MAQFEIENKIVEFMEFLKFIYVERGQLYGAVINLMLYTGQDEVELDFSTFQEMRNKYYIIFLPSEEEQKLTVKLMKEGETYENS